MDLSTFVDNLRRRERAQRADQERLAREVRARLDGAVALLAERFGVGRVVLFGSLAEGDLFGDASDVDLAVEGLAPGVYFRAVDALAERLGVPVDLIRLEEAPAGLAQRIARTGEVLRG